MSWYTEVQSCSWCSETLTGVTLPSATRGPLPASYLVHFLISARELVPNSFKLIKFIDFTGKSRLGLLSEADSGRHSALPPECPAGQH